MENIYRGKFMNRKFLKLTFIILLSLCFMVSCALPFSKKGSSPSKDDVVTDEQDEAMRKLIESDDINLNSEDESEPRASESDVKEYRSTKGSFIIKAPKHMIESKDSTEDFIGLNAGDGKFYGLIAMASPCGIGGSEKALDAVMNNIEGIYQELGVENAMGKKVDSIKVDGLNWQVYEITGALSGIDAKFIIAAAVDDENLYQFQAFSAEDEFNENKVALMDIIKSFRRL